MNDMRQLAQFKLRLPTDLKAWLMDKAKGNRRSLGGEIEYRLERSRQEEQREAA